MDKFRRVKGKAEVNSSLCHNDQVSGTWGGGGVAGEKVIHIVPDRIRPSVVHNEIEGVSIAEKLSGCTASAEREE